MAWTEQQLQTLQTSFSYGSEVHRTLLSEKLKSFEHQRAILQKRNKMVGAGFILGYVTAMFGPSFLLLRSSDLVYMGLGAFIVYSYDLDKEYNVLFSEMQILYDWCIPNSNDLPPVDNALMQKLIETMGTLVRAERIERLVPLINGPLTSQTSSLSGYAASGGQALFGMAKDLVLSSNERSEEKMDVATFTLLMRNLVQGKSTSILDYYLYGEGRFNIAEQLSSRVTLLPMVNRWLNEFLSTSTTNDHPHSHSL